MKNDNSLLNSNSYISEVNSSVEVDDKASSKKSYKKQL